MVRQRYASAMPIDLAPPTLQSNPKPNETVIGTGLSTTQAVNCHIGFPNGIANPWTVVVIVLGFDRTGGLPGAAEGETCDPLNARLRVAVTSLEERQTMTVRR